MKAILSLQFEKFTRAMLVVDHEVSTDLAGLEKRIRKMKGVRNAVFIASHLQWVAFAQADEDIAALIARAVEQHNKGDAM